MKWINSSGKALGFLLPLGLLVTSCHTGNQELNQLPSVRIGSGTSVSRTGEKWNLATTLDNRSEVPALMIRLKVLDENGEMILPALYSDNYVALMPGESRNIVMSVRVEDSRGLKPAVMVSGFHVLD